MTSSKVSKNDLCNEIRQKIVSVQEFDLPVYGPGAKMVLQLPNLAGSTWLPAASWFEFVIRITMNNNANDFLYVPQHAPVSYLDRIQVISPGNSTTIHNIGDIAELHSLIKNVEDINTKSYDINSKPVNETSFAFQSAPFQSNYTPYLVNTVAFGAGVNTIEISSHASLDRILDICAIDALLPLGYLSAGSRSAMRFEFNLRNSNQMAVLGNAGAAGSITKIEVFPRYNMTTLVISEALNAEIERQIMTNSEYLIPLQSFNNTSQSVQSGISTLSTRLFIDEESVSNLMIGFKDNSVLTPENDPVAKWSSGNMNFLQHKTGSVYYPAQPIQRNLSTTDRRDAYQFMSHIFHSKYSELTQRGINIIPQLYHTAAWDESQQFMSIVNLNSGCDGIFTSANIKRIGNGTVECLTKFGTSGAFANASAGTMYFYGQFDQVFVLTTGGLRAIDQSAYNAIVQSLSDKQENMLNELLNISGITGPSSRVI